MDSRTQQLLGYPTTTPTTDQQTALAQLSEIGIEVSQRISRIAQTPNVDKQWLQVGQQQVTQGLMALRQAVLPSSSFELHGGYVGGTTQQQVGSSAR